MSEISDVIKNISETYKERLTTPFFRNYLFGFLIFNWKGLFYLFSSDEKVLIKIKYFEKNFSTCDNIFIKPLLYSIVITCLFHLVAYIFDLPIYKFQITRKKAKNKYLAEIIRSRIDVETAKIDLEEKKQKRLKLEDTNAEIEKLKKEVSEVREEKVKLTDEYSKLNSDKMKFENELIEKNENIKYNNSINSNLLDIKYAQFIGGRLYYITNEEYNNVISITLFDVKLLYFILKEPSQKDFNIYIENHEKNIAIKAFEVIEYLISKDYIHNDLVDIVNNKYSYKLTGKGEVLKNYVLEIEK